MKSMHFPLVLVAALAITFSLAVCAQAQTFTSLHSFCANKTSCADGDGPEAPLVQGTDGNLYGETAFGGGNGSCGFRIGNHRERTRRCDQRHSDSDDLGQHQDCREELVNPAGNLS